MAIQRTIFLDGSRARAHLCGLFAVAGLFFLSADATAAQINAAINRVTGNISLTGSGGSVTIKGYSVTSAAGELNPGAWLSITDHYDMNSGGSVDPNDAWLELGNPPTNTDLSEIEFGAAGDGATIANLQTINLGNAWRKSPFQDVVVEFLLLDGSVTTIAAAYSGGAAYQFGDLDFDGDFDVNDFRTVFVPSYGANTSSLTKLSKYIAGDFNENGATDVFDFIRLNAAYLAAHPGAGALSFGDASIPEPATTVLLVMGGAALLCFHRKRSGIPRAAMISLAFLLAGLVAAEPAPAFTIRNLTTRKLLFWDTFENAPNGVSAGSFTGVTGTVGDDFDPVAHIGTWVMGDEDDPSVVEVEEDIQVTNSTSNFDPGPFQGHNYLRADRINSLVRAIAQFPLQSTPGDKIRLDTMFAIPSNATASNAGIGFVSAVAPNVSALPVTTTTFRRDADNNGTATINTVDGNGPVALDDNVTTELPTLSYTEGAWSRITIDYTVGSSKYAITVNGVTVSNLDLRWEYANFPTETPLPPSIGSVYAFGGGRSGSMSNVSTGFFDAVPELSLLVNKNSGQITLVNEMTDQVDIDLYRISSAAGSLNPSGWNSFDDQNYDGATAWAQLDNTATALSEGFTGGSSTIAIGESIKLGTAYNKSVGAEDLVFEVHLRGTNETYLFTSNNIFYLSGVEGDYNNNGVVDAADYVLWRNALTTAVPLANDVTPLSVSNADYLVWRSNFGAHAGVGAGGNFAMVPEPTTGWLISLPLVGLAALRRTRKGRQR